MKYFWNNNQRMTRLYGEYDCRLDPKGRLKVPSTLLKQLGDQETYTFFVNRGFESNIVMYPEQIWYRITEKLSSLNYYNTKEREFLRYFFRGVKMMTTDSVDRILLNKSLLEHAGIKSDVVLFAFIDKIEIWDKTTYNDKLERPPENYSQLSDQIFGSGFTY
jgi:MraZ protein